MVVHISRQPETIVYRDVDTFCFTPDRLTEDVSEMNVYDWDGGNLMGEMNATDAPSTNERVLMCGRSLADGEFANGLRCATYKESATALKPLREVISPTLTYDSDTNTLMLWFWTNFEVEPSGTPPEYDDTEGTLYWIDESDFDATKKAWRALCCCSGAINRYHVSGGSVQDAVDGYDYLPIFTKPEIKAVRLSPVEGFSDGVPIIDFAGTGGATASEPVDPKDLTYAGEHLSPARNVTWNRVDDAADYDGVIVTVQTGASFHGSYLYAYYQDFTYDSAGGLYSISAERRVEIDAPGTWETCT